MKLKWNFYLSKKRKEKKKNLKLKSTHPHPFVAAFLEPSLEGAMPVNRSVNCFFIFLFYLVMKFSEVVLSMIVWSTAQ